MIVGEIIPIRPKVRLTENSDTMGRSKQLATVWDLVGGPGRQIRRFIMTPYEYGKWTFIKANPYQPESQYVLGHVVPTGKYWYLHLDHDIPFPRWTETHELYRINHPSTYRLGRFSGTL